MADKAQQFGKVKLVDTGSLLKINLNGTDQLIINESTGNMTVGSVDGTGLHIVYANKVNTSEVDVGAMALTETNGLIANQDLSIGSAHAYATYIKTNNVKRIICNSTGDVTVGATDGTGSGTLYIGNTYVRGNLDLSQGLISVKESSNTISGTATVSSLAGYIDVTTTALASMTNPRFMITWRNQYFPASGYYVTYSGGGSSTFRVNAVVAQNATFDWFIINGY